MKNKRVILAVILCAAGFALMLYPSLQMILSGFHETVAVSRYEEGALRYDEEQKKEEFQKAEEYNKSITGQEVHDPFLPGSGIVMPDNYEEILDVELGMMGTLEIPCIDVELPIYHGVSEEVLRKGVGHIQETAFPIGGTGMHAVLSTHRGLPEARLFTDLDKVEIGDMFYVLIFDEVLAYEVDEIRVIEPSDLSSLRPEAEKDYVTLLTCTPYGINSHRLLVRGERREYEPEVKEEIRKRTLHTEWYIPALVTVLILAFAARLWYGAYRRRAEKGEREPEKKQRGGDR